MKRLISITLTVVLLLGMLPATISFAAPVADENVALGKSVYANFSKEGSDPAAVVDGDINTEWTSPAGMSEPFYVTVDLGQPHIISTVVLHNRLAVDHDMYRRSVNIEFSNTPDFSEKDSVVAMPYLPPHPYGVPVEVKAPSNKPYRYVRAIKTLNITHVVNELEIYGHVYDPNAVKIGVDVEGTELEGPVSLLSYLHAMSLKDDINEIFGVKDVMTRAEAAKITADVFAPGSSYSGGVPFEDVPSGHKFYDGMRNAYYLGYIVGSGYSHYRPDDYITASEFVCMTMRALGYADVISNVFAGDTAKIMSQAKRLELFEGISVSDYSNPVTRGDAARIFYNALLAPKLDINAVSEGKLLLDESSNALYDVYGITLTEGIVEENRVTKLNGDPKTSDDDAVVGGYSFIDPDGKLNTFLGNTAIVATHKSNDKKIVLAWLTGSDTSITISANDLASTASDIKSGKIVAYREDGKTKSYSLDSKFKVIRNNLSHPYYTADDLMIDNGRIRLLDNDDNGKYDVVFVEEYTLHYVKTAFYDDEILTFIDSKGDRYDIDIETITMTMAGSGASAPNKLKRDMVVKLYGTEDRTHCRMDLYNAPKKGTVTSLSTDTIAVDGAEFPLSVDYKNAKRTYEAQLDESVSVFVDELGEVIWVERNIDEINGDWVIAYSQAVAFGQGLSPTLKFRMFNQLEQWKELEAAEKVELDGKPISKSDLSTLIKNSLDDNRFEQTLLRYKLNPQGYLCALDTLGTPTKEELATGSYFTADVLVGSAMYTDNSGAFWVADKTDGMGHQMILPAREDTPVFMLPKINGEYPTDSTYDKLFSMTVLESVGSTHKAVDHQLQSYMLDEDGYPAIFSKDVAKTVSAGSAGRDIDSVSETDAPFMLIEKVTTVLDDEGDIAVKVSGKAIGDKGMGSDTSFFIEAEKEILESALLYQDGHASMSTDNGIIDVTTLLEDENADDYISPVNSLGYGDIVRYQLLGTEATAVERVFDYNVNAKPAKGDKPLGYTWCVSGGNNFGYYSAYWRWQIGTVTSASDSAFKVKTLYDLEETYQNTAFKGNIICDGTQLNPKLDIAPSFDRYVNDSNVMIMLFSYNGATRTAIVYQY